jgi:hypothetical protein
MGFIISIDYQHVSLCYQDKFEDCSVAIQCCAMSVWTSHAHADV